VTLDSKTKGILICLCGMVCFGWMDAASKTLSTQLPPVQILWVRYALSIPLALVLAMPGGLRTTLRSARPRLQIARAVFIAAEMTFVVVGYQTVPLADAHAIFALTPLLVTALSVPLLGEQVGLRRWIAVGVGLLGVLIIVRPGFAEISPGMLIMLGCAVMYAFYQVMTRIAGRHDAAATSMVWQTVGGTIALSLVGPFFWINPTGEQWLLLGLVAALGVIGHFGLVLALQYAPAVVVQPFTYTMLIWAAISGWVVFGDVPGPYVVLGALVIVAGGLYAAWRERLRAQPG
jgi:drug/metabolite transporter (DMT)-like permease